MRAEVGVAGVALCHYGCNPSPICPPSRVDPFSFSMTIASTYLHEVSPPTFRCVWRTRGG